MGLFKGSGDAAWGDWFMDQNDKGEVRLLHRTTVRASAAGGKQPAAAAALGGITPPPGTHVELRCLQAKPELNGQRGVVTGFDASSGRCSVQLEDGRGPYKIKPENLEGVVTTKKKEKKKK